MNIHEIVKKLVGKINPVGETTADEKRFENLKVMTELVDSLLKDIDNVYYVNQCSHEYSVKRSADFASKFFTKLGITD